MRPTNWLGFVLVATAALASAATPAAADPTPTASDPAEQTRIARAYLDAVQASDWSGMARHLAADAHYQDYSMEFFDREMIDLRGADAIVDFWRTSGEGAGTVEIRFDFTDQFVAGPNVYFVGPSYVKNRGEAWGFAEEFVEATFLQITHLRIAGGKITYHADHVDYAGAMRQVERYTKIDAATPDAATPDAATTNTGAGSGPPMSDAARRLELPVIEGTDAGSTRPLESWRREHGLLVVFVSNTCPYVIDWADRFARLEALGRERGIGVVVVNSNARRRETTDSPEAMAAFATEHLGELPYLLDPDSQLADLLDAQRTPEALLFDGDLNLVYRGLIDDHSGPLAEVSQHHLGDAIDALGGLAAMPESTTPLGCKVQRPRRRSRG